MIKIAKSYACLISQSKKLEKVLYSFQMDEVAAHSHKFRVSMSERNGRRGLQKLVDYELGASSPPPLVALTHASHVATRPPGCNVMDHQVPYLIFLEEIASKR